MNIYSIYKVINLINGKVYIGFTKNLEARIKAHKKSITKPEIYKSSFHRAIRKYGWDNFTWHTIYQSKDLTHTLNFAENYFIKEYNSFENGYNMTTGGDGRPGLKHNEETKYIIGSRTRGKKLPEKHKNEISKSHIGIKPSLETRLQMSLDRKGAVWYNDGVKNIRSKIHPGKKWIRGKCKVNHHTVTELNQQNHNDHTDVQL
jgi:group I intron endonuclease